jgi:hypothetical protein
MENRILIGVAEPGGAYTAYRQHEGDHPVRIIAWLRAQWQQVHGADTTAMAAAIRTPSAYGRSVAAGQLTEIVDADLDWLFLLHEQAAVVEVHIATAADRWRPYSRHRLATSGDDLFLLDGHGITCTRCRTVDGVEFTTNGPPGTPDRIDTIIRCGHCGATETTDPAFTSRTTA